MDFLFGSRRQKNNFTPRNVKIGDLNYRLIQATDFQIAEIVHLEKDVYSGQMPWSAKDFQREFRKKNSLYLLIYQLGQLAGMIGVRFSKKEAHITFLAVSSFYQGRGIATFLMNFMIQRAKKLFLPKVSLEVKVENLDAQKLYRRLGFEDNFVRKDYYYTPGQEPSDGLNMVLYLK